MSSDNTDENSSIELELAKEKARKPRTKKPKLVVTDPDGQEISLKHVVKYMRDTLSWHHADGIKVVDGKVRWTLDLSSPLTVWSDGQDTTKPLQPSKDSPLCQRCEAYAHCRSPFITPWGSKDPLITVVFEYISHAEDQRGEGGAGLSGQLMDTFSSIAGKINFPFDRIRWLPLTRCRLSKELKMQAKSKANYCGVYAVQDLVLHPPRILMPIGSVCLGYFSYKSNAQDWGGQLMTYRGWPDKWLMDPKYSLPREDGNPASHPLFGPHDENNRVAMFPLQTLGIIRATQNRDIMRGWLRSAAKAMKLSMDGVSPRSYILPHYQLSTDPEFILSRLQELISSPGTLVSFDTETTGLKAFAEGASVVYVMLRWDNKDGPQSIGFPWDWEGSPLKPHLHRIAGPLAEAISVSIIVGHHVSFDALFAIANFAGADLNRIADACVYDTWHEAFVLKQARGSLSLDMMAYQHVPELGGYDEDFTLLISLYPELLDPECGGHYAKCPPQYMDTHFKSYVMGDVEVTLRTHHKLRAKLAECESYRIPLAHPTDRGRFRHYATMSRAQVYDRVVSPAARVLIKMMARGLKVDLKELEFQEQMFPQLIFEARRKLREITPEVLEWCEHMEASEPGWFLDLESKDHLKEVLYTKMRMPIKAITAAGLQKIKDGQFYVDNVNDVLGPISKAEKAIRRTSRDQKDYEEKWADFLKYVAVDKFSLNGLSAENPSLRPLLEYRSIFKQYASYIRTIRNITTKGIDKKARTKDQHLARDGMVHTQFLITGTRSGRLSSRDPNLQQLPARGQVKRIYVSRFGEEGCLYQGDLSQIELRLIAAACGDEAMVNAYIQGIDLHSLTMSKIFKMPYEHCIKDHVSALQKAGKDKEAKECEMKRKIAKTINFLTGYGGGAQGLQATLAQDGVYKTLDECEAFLEAFFDSYPALRKYLAYYKGFIEKNGVAVSMLGRVRIFEEVGSDDHGLVSKALRAGCNHLIQATASDMMLCCICAIETLMREANMRSLLVSTVHDSLLIDSVREELPQLHEIVMSVFSNIPEVLETWLGDDVDLSWTRMLPFDGDSEVGRNYLDMVKLSRQGNDWTDIFRRMDAE